VQPVTRTMRGRFFLRHTLLRTRLKARFPFGGS
jgi:hypothetical protein